MSADRRVRIDYTNHRGERAWRSIIPASVRFAAAPPWHREEQYLLRAFDADRGAVREFAMRNIHAWEFPR